MRKSAIVIGVAGALAASASWAQNAIDDPRPVRAVFEGESVWVALVSGDAPAAVPTRPVETWGWTVYARPMLTGDRAFDVSATLMTFDCAADRVSYGATQNYRDGRLINSDTSGLKPETVTRGRGPSGSMLEAVCDPNSTYDLRYGSPREGIAGARDWMAGS